MPDLRFKRLTVNNWLEPDRVMSYFIQTSRETGETQPMTGEDWLEEILEPRLSEEVPVQIHALFEAARGALVYGYLFYPLLHLGFRATFSRHRSGHQSKGQRYERPCFTKNFRIKDRLFGREGFNR